jgi:hypothetical protein
MRPALMQRLQTRTRFTAPPSTILTACKFGSQRRFVLLFAWLTLLPTEGLLPHE